MEIAALWSCCVNELWAYRRERLRVRILLPAAIFLTVAAACASTTRDVSGLCSDLLLALLLVAQFRLWDDLCDVGQDRIDHPTRVLCQLTSHHQFWIVHTGLIAVNLTLVMSLGTPDIVLAFLVLNLFFFVWYAGVRRFIASRLISCQVVLLKYPVFVLLLCNEIPAFDSWRPWSCAAIVYLCFCVFELLDDRRLHHVRGNTICLSVQMMILAIVLSLTVIDRYNQKDSDAMQPAVAGVGTIVLVSLFVRHLVRLKSEAKILTVNTEPVANRSVVAGLINYSVFVVGMCALLCGPGLSSAVSNTT